MCRAGAEAASLQHDASPPQSEQPRPEGDGDGTATNPDSDSSTDSHAESNQAPGPQPPPLSETESDSDVHSDSDSASKTGPQDEHADDNSIPAQSSGADVDETDAAVTTNSSTDTHEQASDSPAGAEAQSAGQSSGNQQQAIATASGRDATGVGSEQLASPSSSQAGDTPASLQSTSKEETNGSSTGDVKGKPKGSPEEDAERGGPSQSLFSSSPSPPIDIKPARSDPASNALQQLDPLPACQVLPRLTPAVAKVHLLHLRAPCLKLHQRKQQRTLARSRPQK